METIITAATVLAMYFNLSTSTGGNYCYNADIENNKVTTLSVYNKEGKYLAQKLQYKFNYDAENRLESKEALRWNDDTKSWENYYKLNYSYSANGYVLERCDWNEKTHSYDMAAEKTDYAMMAGNVMAVNHYEWSENDGEYEKVNNILVVNPQAETLLAIEKEMQK